MRLPLLLCQAIPGQEEENAAYLTRKGAALWIQNNHNLTGTVYDLLAKPEQLRYMREMTAQLARPAAAQTIANIVWQNLFSSGAAASR